MKFFKIVLKSLLFSFFFSIFVGCQTTPCNIQDRNLSIAEQKTVDAKVADLKKDSVMKNVKVYKPDGSLQCNQGKPISLKEMESELKTIKIFSAEKIHDGLMRIQVCGAPTGMSNVFEIAESDLEKAKTFGFKIWKKD